MFERYAFHMILVSCQLCMPHFSWTWSNLLGGTRKRRRELNFFSKGDLNMFFLGEPKIEEGSCDP